MSMNFKHYQELSLRTMPVDQSKEDRILNCLLGIGGESGELLDLYKKSKYQGHKLDKRKVVEEIGDILFYLANLCTAMELELGECALNNHCKLKLRYPNGFTTEDSIKRVDVNE